MTGVAGPLEIVEAMAAALQPITLEIDGLQITSFFNPNPTPPSVDIYPGEPFQAGSSFGSSVDYFFTVRARATTADHESGQRCLLRLLDRWGPASVYANLTADQTLGGVVDNVSVPDDGVSGYVEFIEDVQTGGRLLGCTWRVEVGT